MRELPVGWEITTIENVLEPKYEGKTIQQGWSPRCEKHSSSSNNTWGVLKTTAIQAGYFIENENKELPEHLTPKEQIEVSEGDILLTCAGPRNRCGVPTLVRKTRPKLMMSGKMYRFRAFEEYFQPSFLELYLLSHEAQLAIDKMKTGSSDSGLNLTHGRFRELLIPVPPFKEQQRIVDKVEELFSELDKGIESLKTAKDQLTVYRQALLKHAFEGKLTEQWRASNADKLESPEQLLARIQQEREARYQQQLDDWTQEVEEWEADGKGGKKPSKPKKYTPSVIMDNEKISGLPESWESVKFSELLFSIRGGTTTPPLDIETNYPVLRSSSVRQSNIDYSDIRYLSGETIKNKADFVEQGDLLFSRLNGSIEFVGNCALVKRNHPENLIYPDRLYCAKLVIGSLAEYCELFFSSPNVRNSIEKKAKSTAGHKRISIPDVTEQIIPLPSPIEIKQIVNIVEEKLSVTSKLIENIDTDIKRAELLRQSILKKAFSGQLVPQDPDDKPASELLKKIAIEKAELAEKDKAEKAAARKAKAAAKKAKT